MHWSRRGLLATAGLAATAAVAGCTGPDGASAGRVRMTVHRVARSLLTSTWTPLAPYREEFERALDRIVAGERVVTTGYAPVPSGEFVEHEGTYYRTDAVAVGREERRRHVLRLAWVGRTDEAGVPEGTPVESLPDRDGYAAMFASFAATARRHGGSAPWDRIERGGHVFRNVDPDESELFPTADHEHLRFHRTVFAVTVREETVVEPTFRAVAHPVADAEATFVDAALAERLETTFYPGQLPDAEREVVWALVDDRDYVERAPVSEAFAAVLHRLGMDEVGDYRPDDDAVPPRPGRRAFECDGRYYRCWVEYEA